jgi:hypothetical protein
VLELYLFKVRNPITGKWRRTRQRSTVDAARKRYGEGNFEPIEGSREVRELDARWKNMAHLARNYEGE